MPSFTRTASATAPHPSLALVLPLVGVLASGCYSVSETTDDTGASAEGLTGSGGSGGSSTGPVTGERGILQADGFKLYWEHYDAWEQGACTRLRLKNEGGEVAGWSMTIDLSDDITNWIDSGGAFMWLVDDQLLVEQDDFDDFESWESAEMYFCAEPAVELDHFDITYQSSEDRGSSGGSDGGSDADPDDLPGFSGTMDYTDADGRAARLTYESWITADLSCVDFEVENRSRTPLVIEGFRLALSNDTDVLLHEGGTPAESPADELDYVLDAREATDPGESASARVCMSPLARPTSLLDLRLSDPA